VNKTLKPVRLTQAEIAHRLGISQSACAQQEVKEAVRKSTHEKIARALGSTKQLTI
jgi:predicted transcriptional regulator